jgi:hypothetical protein
MRAALDRQDLVLVDLDRYALFVTIVSKLSDEPARTSFENRRRTTSAFPPEWDFWIWRESGS